MRIVALELGKYNRADGKTIRLDAGNELEVASAYGRVLVAEGFARLPGEKPVPEDVPDSAEIDATDAARKTAVQFGIDLRTVEGTGKGGRVLKDDVLRAVGEDL